MDLRKFPFDEQKCFIQFESCKYFTINFSLKLAPIRHSDLVSINILNFEFFEQTVDVYTSVGNKN